MYNRNRQLLFQSPRKYQRVSKRCHSSPMKFKNRSLYSSTLLRSLLRYERGGGYEDYSVVLWFYDHNSVVPWSCWTHSKYFIVVILIWLQSLKLVGFPTNYNFSSLISSMTRVQLAIYLLKTLDYRDLPDEIKKTIATGSDRELLQVLHHTLNQHFLLHKQLMVSGNHSNFDKLPPISERGPN